MAGFTRGSGSRRHVAALVVAAAVLTGTACGGDAVRSDESGEVTQAGDVDVFELSVGDCLEEGPEGSVTDVQVVPCSEEHDQEVYAEFSLPDGEWAGQEETEVAVEEGCYDRFADFVGVAYEESELDFAYVMPTEESWADGDRVVHCTVFDPAGPVTGSLADAGR
jgi:hypothetical protein